MDPDAELAGIVVELVVDGFRRTWCRLPACPNGIVAGEGDLALVDLLARLQMSARRAGGRIEVRGVPGPTAEFIRFVGLAGHLGPDPA